MAEHRYAQFCPTARAAEILGERWTLLIARELLCGAQRFSDLRRRLPGLSSSVLAERLSRLEERGLVERSELLPPAPATQYALTALGAELRPAMLELIRFGVRFIEPPRPDDHLEPDWMRLALEAFARREATPRLRFAVAIPDEGGDVRMHVAGDVRMHEGGDVRMHVVGGRRGTRVSDAGGAFDVSLRCGPLPLLGLISGSLAPDAALASGVLEAEGELSVLKEFPALFDLASLLARPEPNPDP